MVETNFVSSAFEELIDTHIRDHKVAVRQRSKASIHISVFDLEEIIDKSGDIKLIPDIYQDYNISVFGSTDFDGDDKMKNHAEFHIFSTLEFDVYSFGMVVLEVVCGRRSRGMMEENSLVDHVWTTHEKNELFTCVDPTLEGKFDEEEVRRSILVGLACMHPDRRHRPRMRKVVQIFMNPDEPLIKIAVSRPTAVSLPLHSSRSDSIASEFSSNKAPAEGKGSMDSFPDEMTVVFDDR
ncbi:L-type lectin-domain containing receptor kinase VIII.1-like [Coffea eugenioides]|uniref:L-type lectin-domain containing receptor kinase VIII.1-like n=1 Tax=Coffea eugenioides TaxID=49369 RepID=UPI000F606205|nr:L-type lectin-domain containing receptor kinase VIII.1-like [Coffea eugenioides]